MAFIDVDSINRAVNEIGVNVTIKSFTGTPEYDEDQNLVNPNDIIETTAIRGKPSKRDIEQDGGMSKISYNDVKLRLLECVNAKVGDEVSLRNDDNTYYIISFGKTDLSVESSKIIFISTSQ